MTNTRPPPPSVQVGLSIPRLILLIHVSILKMSHENMIASSKNISTHSLTCKLQETATDTSNSRWIIWQFSRENFFSLIIWHLTWKTYDVEVKLKGWFVHVKSSKMTSTLFDFLLTFFPDFLIGPSLTLKLFEILEPNIFIQSTDLIFYQFIS